MELAYKPKCPTKSPKPACHGNEAARRDVGCVKGSPRSVGDALTIRVLAELFGFAGHIGARAHFARVHAETLRRFGRDGACGTRAVTTKIKFEAIFKQSTATLASAAAFDASATRPRHGLIVIACKLVSAEPDVT